MKIYKKKDKIIFEIPKWTKRFNPYMPNKDVGSHQTLVGIIRNDKHGNQELGFANVIDMSYSGKPDQNTDIIIYIEYLEKLEFIKLCKDLELNYIEYPICAYCNKTIYGAFTIGDKGNMSDKCNIQK